MGKRSPRPGFMSHGLFLLARGPRHPCGRQASRTLDHRHRARQVTHRLLRVDGLRPQGQPPLPKPRVHRASTGPETSGVLVFAKSEEAKLRLQGTWDETEKRYLAVIHGQCRKSEDTITTYLAENKAHVVYSTPDASKGKLARTAYKVLKQTKAFALLEVNLLTGRKNQIRVHLAGIGHPHRGRSQIWQREGILRWSRTSRPVDLLHASR